MARNTDQPKDVTGERVNMTGRVLDKHYDKGSVPTNRPPVARHSLRSASSRALRPVAGGYVAAVTHTPGLAPV